MTKYIFISAVNYESATAFKVSGKCNKCEVFAEGREICS